MNKKYIVRLSDEERKVCEKVIQDSKGKSGRLRPAQIRLKADADAPRWMDQKIHEAIGCRGGLWRTCEWRGFWKSLKQH